MTKSGSKITQLLLSSILLLLQALLWLVKLDEKHWLDILLGFEIEISLDLLELLHLQRSMDIVLASFNCVLFTLGNPKKLQVIWFCERMNFLLVLLLLILRHVDTDWQMNKAWSEWHDVLVYQTSTDFTQRFLLVKHVCVKSSIT